MTDAPASGAAAPSAARLLTAAAFSGAAVMIIELTISRALGPWFGTSLYTWTNAIGVVLVALAAGYALGGRLADRRPEAPRLAQILLFGALLSVPAPFLTGPVSEWLLPEPAALSPLVATGHVVRGSLVVTLLLFALPLFLMGMVGPFVTRLLVDRGVPGGTAAGRTLAWSTAGSLVGTYLPAHFLIEQVGVRMTLLVASALLLVAAVMVGLRGRRAMSAAGLVLALLLGAGFLAQSLSIRGPIPRLGIGGLEEEEVIEEIESAYQYLRLTRWTGGSAGGEPIRELRLSLDEGVAEFHSVKREGSPLTGGSYYDAYAILPELIGQSDSVDVAILGGGAGTMSSMLRQLHPQSIGKLVDVEIDPRIADLRPRFGWEPGGDDHPLVGDARVVLRALDHRFDVIIVDAYARQITIPPHLASVEFFRLVARRLGEGGVCAMNVSTHDLESPLVSALRRTMREVFPSIAAVSISGSWNLVLLASLDPAARFRPVRPASSSELVPVRHSFLEGLRNLVVDDAERSGLLLTDDAAPLEQLARRR